MFDNSKFRSRSHKNKFFKYDFLSIANDCDKFVVIYNLYGLKQNLLVPMFEEKAVDELSLKKEKSIMEKLQKK